MKKNGQQLPTPFNQIIIQTNLPNRDIIVLKYVGL
jgi:hypothetical protein